MSQTLRDLLIQRGARLQERPALTAPEWGTLSYAQLRNRVEGVALGLLATQSGPALFAATGTLWDWAAELAVAASALVWDPSGAQVPLEVLGGPRFNDDAGRGPYHALEHCLNEATLFRPGLSHGQWLNQLRRWNERHGWDHDTEITLPRERLGEPPFSAALWCALYAGAHATLALPMPRGQSWNAAMFEELA
ncbi:MAG TPA: hypothetical protein VJ486_09035 [Geothrix sp.]|nr:hypothetical protein [Geothrix sp.]